MAIYDYYEAYMLQEYKRVPSGFPPPFEWDYLWTDGVQVDGKLLQDQSAETLIAGAQGIRTRGRFVTAPNVPIHDGDVLRRVSGNEESPTGILTGVFIRIIGDPIVAPEQAESQMKSYVAEITERNDETPTGFRAPGA